MSSAITLPVPNGAIARAPVPVDYEAVLRFLGLNPREASTQALLLTCQRYDLDPVMRHMILIQGRPYITRDGLLHVAHRSGQFDGIEVLEQGETPSHHTAKVSVYRKDMGRPFTYIGRYPKNGGNKAYGPEMAVKCGEVMALRRAFNVALCAREEVWDQDVEVETTAYVEPSRDEGRRAVNEDFRPRRPRSVPEPPEDISDDSDPMTWPAFAAAAAKAHNDALEAFYVSNDVDSNSRHHFKVNAHQLAQYVAGKAVEKGMKAPEKKTQSWASGLADRLWRSKPSQVENVVEGHLAEKMSEARKMFGQFEEEPKPEEESQEPAGAREPGSNNAE